MTCGKLFNKTTLIPEYCGRRNMHEGECALREPKPVAKCNKRFSLVSDGWSVPTSEWCGRMKKHEGECALREPGTRVPARLDADKSAKPLSSIVGKAKEGDCVGPGITKGTEYRDETGLRIALDFQKANQDATAARAKAAGLEREYEDLERNRSRFLDAVSQLLVTTSPIEADTLAMRIGTLATHIAMSSPLVLYGIARVVEREVRPIVAKEVAKQGSVNKYGLTYEYWLNAADQNEPTDENLNAWLAGEDPTEWRFYVDGHRTP
jgi:hypothetical protein